MVLPLAERRRRRAADLAILGLFVMVAIYGVHLARPVLLPLIPALLLNLGLKPVPRALERSGSSRPAGAQ